MKSYLVILLWIRSIIFTLLVCLTNGTNFIIQSVLLKMVQLLKLLEIRPPKRSTGMITDRLDKISKKSYDKKVKEIRERNRS